MTKKTLLTSLLLFLYVFSSCQTTVSGKVVAVADGDTMTILTDDKRQVKIRLYGVDSPEKRQDFGTTARQLTSELIFGKRVKVHVKNKDRYGRSIGFVVLPDGRNLNKELLKAGMAWHYKEYDKSAEFAELENKARKGRLGVWSMPNPVAPWDFRKGRSTSNKASSVSGKASFKSNSVSLQCGAPTKATGKPCKRPVKGGGRCYQHR